MSSLLSFPHKRQFSQIDIILHTFFISPMIFTKCQNRAQYTHKTNRRRDAALYDETLCKPFHMMLHYKRSIQYQGFTRLKFNLHSAFKQKRVQPCVGELSGVLRDLIYGRLSKQDPIPPSVERNFRPVTHHFRLRRDRLRSYRTSSRFLLFYDRRIPAQIMTCIVSINAKISRDARLCKTFYSLLPPGCISPAAGRQSTTRYKGQGYLYAAIKGLI